MKTARLFASRFWLLAACLGFVASGPTNLSRAQAPSRFTNTPAASAVSTNTGPNPSAAGSPANTPPGRQPAAGEPACACGPAGGGNRHQRRPERPGKGDFRRPDLGGRHRARVGLRPS